MKLRTTMLAGAGAAVLAYLFDPQAGTGRRQRLMGRAAGRLRKTGRRMRRRGEYVVGTAVGKAHGLRPERPPENDQTLVAKVRSEVLGREEWRHHVVNVGAADGVVMLNGQLDHPEEIERLQADVLRVTGVRGVENALHLPGTLPPNKREVMTARVT